MFSFALTIVPRGKRDLGLRSIVNRKNQNMSKPSGYLQYPDDPFEDHAGPFFYRVDEKNQISCQVTLTEKHCNSHGTAHGGFLMTFADYCAGILASRSLNSSIVTVSLTAEFTSGFLLRAKLPLGTKVGEVLEAVGEVAHTTHTLAFVQGKILSGTRVVLTVCLLFAYLLFASIEVLLVPNDCGSICFPSPQRAVLD